MIERMGRMLSAAGKLSFRGAASVCAKLISVLRSPVPAGPARFLSGCRDMVLFLVILALLYGVFYYSGKAFDFRAKGIKYDEEKGRWEIPLDGLGKTSCLSRKELDLLEKKGLADPPEDIVNALRNRGFVLIRNAPTGVPAGFSFGENVQILNGRWMMVDIYGGNGMGKVILEYHVGDDGELSWRVMDAYVEPQ